MCNFLCLSLIHISIYARATLAALNKDFDTAEKMFEEAARKGMPEAEKMLRQIEEIK